MRAAAWAPSLRRTALIASGGSSAEPQSAGGIVAPGGFEPCWRTGRVSVPAHRNSASSGWARTLRTTSDIGLPPPRSPPRLRRARQLGGPRRLGRRLLQVAPLLDGVADGFLDQLLALGVLVER